MKRNLLVLIATMALLVAGCGSDKPKTNPNAPIAPQPNQAAPANGWTASQLKEASQRCGSYGFNNSAWFSVDLNTWVSFCSCAYTAISALCTYDQMAYYGQTCVDNAEAKNKSVSTCLTSSGLGAGQKSSDLISDDTSALDSGAI